MASFRSFELKDQGQVKQIVCPSRITEPVVLEELASIVEFFLNSDAKVCVFDFTRTDAIAVGAYKPIIQLAQGLKSQGRFLYSVGLGKELLRQVRDAGVEQSFSPVVSVEKAKQFAGIKSSNTTINVAFVNPFISATQNAIEIQTNTKVKVGKPFLKRGNDELTSTIDISGVISLMSDSFCGSVAICFPSKVFLAIYEKMVGEKATEINKDSQDAAAELLNIIFGQAKAILNDQKGYNIQKAIPVVVRGNELKVHHISRSVAIILPFETEFGPFHMEISSDPIPEHLGSPV